jgi:hypothetical protein
LVATLGVTTVALGRRLGVLINPADVAAVADGVLVNAVWAVGQMVARPRESRRAAAGLDTAGWMDTERLTREGLPGARLELPELTDAEEAELETALTRDEVQGTLQALLAVRLTDAPETEAAKAREAVRLALGGTPAAGARYAGQLSEYFDDKVSALVATLEGRVGLEGLAQVRAEAYHSRIVALLGTIADMLATLSHPDRGGPEEAEFLRRYRRQVRERHGKLEPPDFERRRKVPVEKIYVNTPVREYLTRLTEYVAKRPTPDLNVMDLARLLDRTVLLGDPGGGKTTAANVLANAFASDPTEKVPFLVTLRDYAAEDPPERSMAGHIEHTLETLYQCRAPDGLVERLLLTERAVVIFDGLDELLDTSRRRDVSDLVEQFCVAYPLTPVLVTSRLVGYDQAMLDDDQFTSYRLGDFGDGQVAEYANKWFAVQEGFTTAEAKAEAEAFLAESASVPDLRSNPILLSLMCILYRGAGSLPRDRVGIYTRCTELLLGKWDERRRIHREQQAWHFVEPAIRHLAWLLLSWYGPVAEALKIWPAAIAERKLIAEMTEFLLTHGFGSQDEAGAAAREFVEFCSGRMWVLCEFGTNADGERLYGFIHKTFLEYFAAAHLATVSDSSEDLARVLARLLGRGDLEDVAELAIQIKDRNSDHGTDGIYTALLDPELMSKDRPRTLKFLAKCMPSVHPSPAAVRILTRATLDYFDRDAVLAQHDAGPLWALLTHSVGYEETVAAELSSHVSTMVSAGDPAVRVDGLLLALATRSHVTGPSASFWLHWSGEQARRYEAEIIAEAAQDYELRNAALHNSVISISQALSMPNGFGSLIETYPGRGWAGWSLPYALDLFRRLSSENADTDAVAALGAPF